jgi:hypothetical protein
MNEVYNGEDYDNQDCTIPSTEDVLCKDRNMCEIIGHEPMVTREPISWNESMPDEGAASLLLVFGGAQDNGHTHLDVYGVLVLLLLASTGSPSPPRHGHHRHLYKYE